MLSKNWQQTFIEAENTSVGFKINRKGKRDFKKLLFLII